MQCMHAQFAICTKHSSMQTARRLSDDLTHLSQLLPLQPKVKPNTYQSQRREVCVIHWHISTFNVLLIVFMRCMSIAYLYMESQTHMMGYRWFDGNTLLSIACILFVSKLVHSCTVGTYSVVCC